VQRHAAEHVEVELDRSGVTPGPIHEVTQYIARVGLRFTQLRTRTAGLVGRVPLSAG
jgi:hypothetical protein